MRGEKKQLTHETVLKKGVWQKKKLTTAHEVVVSCAKQAYSMVRFYIRLGYKPPTCDARNNKEPPPSALVPNTHSFLARSLGARVLPINTSHPHHIH